MPPRTAPISSKRFPSAQDSCGLQRLVWQSLKPTNWSIYYFAGLQAAPRQITSGPGLDYDAVLSPDGHWVVFTSERSGIPHLYALNLRQGGDPRLLIDSDSMEDQAAISPDGRMMAFMSDHSGSANLYLAPFDPATTQPLGRAVNLTNHSSGNFRPAFSPDGKWIAFSSDRDRPVASNPFFPFVRQREGEIYVMDLEGKNLRRLTNSQNWNGSPVWSPDGSTIYFYSGRNRETAPPQSPILSQKGGFELWRMNADGSGQRRITPAGTEALSPTVADGRIVFATRSTWKDWHLASVNPDGSDLRRETHGEINYWNPCCNSRTGAMVAHGVGPIAGETQAVEEILGPGPLLSPDFPIALAAPEIPGGALALYPMRHTSGLAPHPHRNEVIVTIEDAKGTTLAHANFDGTNQTGLFFLPGVGIIASEDHRGRVFDVKYSGDGELVTFTEGVFSGEQGDRADVWRMRPDGSGRVNLTQLSRLGSRVNEGMSTISPCGKRIVFRSTRRGFFNLYLMDLDGANVRRLTNGEWRDNFPVFSPAGDEIAFSSNRDAIPDQSGYRTFDNYILRIGPDGSPGEIRRVTNTSGQTSHPYFSPDGNWICYTSERGGINDEEPVVQEVVFAPQMYGDIYLQRLSDGMTIRVTHNKWEDGTVFWLPAGDPAEKRF
ncbi:MAG TPA: DPP IV N-terminal domain-containing protein [Bryobacteraceae bacterium]|nr:DPP IV N-terminal domain-containing protein [Bryobacteraceae bacterium]